MRKWKDEVRTLLLRVVVAVVLVLILAVLLRAEEALTYSDVFFDKVRTQYLTSAIRPPTINH